MAFGDIPDHTPQYLDQVRNWIETCNDLHGDICVPDLISERPSEDVPRWLIDTQQQCIVSGVSADRYMALSYVWPETRGFSDSTSPHPDSSPHPQLTLLLDTASVAEFQKAGFLSSEDILQRIPMVIQHALWLTRVLGVRYLWVDRLCVVQNDLEEGGTLSQVAKMDKIYAGAYVTYIAAASEDIYKQRLLGEWPLFNTTRSRYSFESWKSKLPDHSNISKEEILRAMSARYNRISNSTWATRGWTYQEQILCKRALVFVREGFFWDCQCCLWDWIDLFPGQNFDGLPLRADMGQRFSTRWWPDFSFYLDLICPYNGRNFSYPQDAMLGISGVLNALGNSFPGGFIFGLPRLFLDHALLWQPFGTADRRVDRTEDGTVLSSLPSWSWCGWQVYVDPWSLRSGLSYIDRKEYRDRAGSWSTRNLVEWRLSIADGAEEPVIEPGILDRYVDMASITDHKIPDGWMRYNVPKPSSETEAASAGPLFTHAKDKHTYFRYPVPLKQAAVGRSLLATPAYLTCSTGTVSFFAAAVLMCNASNSTSIMGPSKISAFEDRIFEMGPPEGKTCSILVLQQPHGAFAGLLRLMGEDCFHRDNPLKLIAVSIGSANRRDLRASLEWKLFETRYDFYDAGNEQQEFHYSPAWISNNGKQAMKFDIAMAFDKEAVRKHTRWVSFCSRKWSAARNSSLSKQSESLHKENTETQSVIKGDPEETICEFYNVLWIERKDGIAYRRACGWVPKYIWEAYATGPIEVKLG